MYPFFQIYPLSRPFERGFNLNNIQHTADKTRRFGFSSIGVKVIASHHWWCVTCASHVRDVCGSRELRVVVRCKIAVFLPLHAGCCLRLGKG